MKKIFIGILALIVMIAICSCTKTENNTENKENMENNEISAIDNPSNDKDEQSPATTNKEFTVETIENVAETPDSDFEYEEVDDGIRITRYNGDDEIVVIPEKIKGKQVISVSEYAFANNHTLKRLKIPDTISKIEKRSFQNCVELLIFVSGDELMIIDEYAFSGCSKLNNVVLNEGIEELKMSCFFATNLKEIYIPASVSIIDYPFSENNKDELTIIALDSSVAHNFAIENGYGYTAK